VRETLKEFCDRVEREPWTGLSTAFRSGAKAALNGGECRYGFRRDFEEAWRRGFEAMRENLASGNEVTMPQEVVVQPGCPAAVTAGQAGAE
jgi:hypothetical protein